MLTATGLFNLGINVFGPLFNAERNQQRVEIEKARTEQLLNVYEQTILNAFREVEDALVAVQTYCDEYEIRRGRSKPPKTRSISRTPGTREVGRASWR